MNVPLDLASNRQQNRIKIKIADVPHPFLKWAGGKRQLINQIDPYLPTSFENYIEPFVGGGALFFYLLPSNAILMDFNPVLINVYRVIKNNVEELIELLQLHKNEKEYYYSIREMDRLPEFTAKSDVEKASRTIYLNRCCFNGLYRVNSKGYFNVPFGKYKNPNYCDKPNLRAVSQALQDVSILEASFSRVMEFATPESFVYFDPPYMPVSETANFTSYTQDNFGKDDQIQLKQVADQLNAKGSRFLLSNSYCDFILDLYQDYTIHTVQATRAINSDAKKRGKIPEVLISNY
ncbi:MAG: DNA adenine methylase [Promethearchaeota archaeon]|nr:MAG: DNA adenine methylase [Candidatus Lokiarchaeota archaeon]